MGLFDLFQTKNKSDDENTHTLVIFDWDSMKKDLDLDFLQNIDNPVLWFFTRSESDRSWEKLKARYPLQAFTLPSYESSLTVFLTNSVIFEVASNPIYKHVAFVSSTARFQGAVEMLKEKKYSAECIAVEEDPDYARRMKKRGAYSRDAQGRQSKGRDGRDSRDARGRQDARQSASRDARNDSRNQDSRSAKSGDDRAKKQEQSRKPAGQQPSADDLNRIVNYFNKNYNIGEVYQKSFLGMLVKNATQRNTQQVLGSKNAKPLISALIKNKCIEQEDSQHFRVVKHASVEMFDRLKDRSRNSGRNKNNSRGGGQRPNGNPQAVKSNQ